VWREISNIEAGKKIPKVNVIIDEIVFNCILEINIPYPDINIEDYFTPYNYNENILNEIANEQHIQQAILTLMHNDNLYSDNQKAKVTFDGSSDILTVIVLNSGKTLANDEQKFIFTHFFRGNNAQRQQGFGLGLVLAQRIFAIHNATIQYHSKENIKNIF